LAANKRPLIEVALQTPHHLAGIRVAVASNAMRPGEFFILYLAIGAPHGVAYFLQQQSNSVMQITKAAGVIFLWPLVWIKRARTRHTRKQVSETFSEEFDPAFCEDRSKQTPTAGGVRKSPKRIERIYFAREAV
jgi:hypothetical protein